MHRLWQRIYDYWDYIYFPGLRRRIAGVVALVAAAIVAAVCLYRPPLPDEVEQAEPLIATYPDSAYALLTRVEPEVQDCSESNRMRFYLLYAEAANKAFAQLPSDSVMRCVVRHYEQNGTSHECLRAHYALGCTYRDLKLMGKAQQHYLMAVEYADTTSPECDYPLLARVYGQLGEVYEYRTSPRMALEMYQQAANYALRGKDSLMWVDAYRQRTVPYMDMNMWDSVEVICRNSSKLYSAYGDTVNVALNYHTLALTCLEQGRISEAGKYISLFEEKSGLITKEHLIAPGIRRASYYPLKGDYYLEKSELDSALLFFYRELSVGEEAYTRGAYENLAKTYKKIGIQDSILKYQDLYTQALTQYYDKQVGLQLQEFQTIFDLDRERMYAEQKAQEAHKLSVWIWWLCGIALLCISAAFSLYIIRRRKHRLAVAHLRRSQYHLERLEADTAEKVRMLESSTEERQKIIVELQEQLQKYKGCVEKLQDYGSKHVPQELSDESSMQEMFSLTVVNKLRMYVKKGKGLNASHQLWGELYDYVEINNVQLILFLAASAKKLNEKEQRVCYLVWIGFTPTEMSILLTTTKQNISTIRSRLLRKLFNVDGKSEDFDKKIKEVSSYFKD